MILIKLGGSVITNKSQYRTFNKERVAKLCHEIKESGEDVIIVHGAGSFGHILAKENHLNDGFCDDSQIPALAQVCFDVRELNSMVVKELIAAGIPAISIPTGSCFIMNDRKLIIDNEDILRGFVDKGIMPVMFGDVVLDKKLGFAICSGDQIMELLAKIFKPKRAIFVSDIDGLYSRDPKNNPEALLYKAVDKNIMDKVKSEMSVADVTGGVYSKMQTMLRMCSNGRDCILVNGTVEGRLFSLLKGEEVICTKAEGD